MSRWVRKGFPPRNEPFSNPAGHAHVPTRTPRGLSPQMPHINRQRKPMPAMCVAMCHYATSPVCCLVAITISTSASSIQRVNLGPSGSSPCLVFLPTWGDAFPRRPEGIFLFLCPESIWNQYSGGGSRRGLTLLATTL